MAIKKGAKKKPAMKKKSPTKKKVAKKTGKKTAKKAGKKKASRRAVRTPSAAFMRARQPSPELAQIVGPKAMPSTEVVRKLWVYIKKHGLQDTKDKRNINADENLRSVFGGKRQVSMFEMTKLVNRHLS